MGRRTPGGDIVITDPAEHRDDVSGRVAIIHDVTDRQERKQELQRPTAHLERQNDRLEEFASVLSHDLRNPLTVARGRLELAEEEGSVAELDGVRAAHERMGSIIDEISPWPEKDRRSRRRRRSIPPEGREDVFEPVSRPTTTGPGSGSRSSRPTVGRSLPPRASRTSSRNTVSRRLGGARLPGLGSRSDCPPCALRSKRCEVTGETTPGDRTERDRSLHKHLTHTRHSTGMAPIDRRRALQVTAGSLGTLLAGCFDIAGGGTDPGSAGDSTDSAADGTDGAATPGGSVVGVDSVHLDPNVTGSDWYSDGAVGTVALADTDERASALVDSLDIQPSRQAPVAEFFRETDFDTSLVALVTSVGPDTCYGTVAVDGLAVEEGRLVGLVAATATTDDACSQAITYPSALVRATFDGTTPDAATFEITNGWGETAAVTARVDGETAPEPNDLPGHVRPDDDPMVRAPLSWDRAAFDRHERWASEPPWRARHRR